MKAFRFLFTFLFLFSFVPGLVFAQADFADIDDTDYEDSIESLSEMGVIQGYDDGTFKPLNSVNRAEMLKMILLAVDEDAQEYEGDCFPDVTDQWFAPYVCLAKEKGIVDGHEDGYFRPGDEANMAEAFKIVINAFDLPVDDLEDVEDWFIPYREFVHNNNLFSKYSYLPGNLANRGEVAFLVDKMMEIQRKESYVSAERDSASLGCGKSSPGIVPSTFMVDGTERDAIVVIPSDYDKDKAIPLVFAFHGRTNSNDDVKKYYGIEKPSGGNAIFVYPAGIQGSSGYTWSDGGDSSGDLRDYEFFDVMFEEISENYCVDLDKVYGVGHSLGAWFTNSLSCARGDVLRAVGTLGGSRSNSECTGPVAAMQWHNPNDELASFAGAETTRDWYLAQNQCSQGYDSVSPFWGNCVQYEGCSDIAPVIFCPHENDYDSRGNYYTHNWPKATGEEIWNFFESLE
ncbi:hypothetical protein HN709_00115 [Candidatus Peregrinibacteria bacterium]|jgi:polyhydroxybutyrate depolymerase|nr:hypothetical protein [Candidatus Peregrinibacteria bacterium]MBT7736076.1 hypothetical protein [Candidatus Peregrinibacteria bacterium]